jgi:GT2 family glycosyltransferase/protoporphyrinogen oxidase
MTKVTIIGAGIAGLSSGWLLKQRGVDFTVIESQSYPGGLARSFEWNGFNCDFAAHRLFTSDENVLHQLLALVPMGRQIRRSRIYLRGHWMRDPLDVIELTQNLSVSERLKVLWSYLLRDQKLEETSFQNYVLKRYGSGLYNYFFGPYTEKLFGIPGDEISVLWARQKVRLANPLDNLRENTKTKFQYFYYPIRGGYGAIANRLFEEIREHVVLNARVTGFDIQDDIITNVHYVKDGCQLESPSDAVISTLPLSITTKMLGHTFNFQFQKVDAVYLLINKPFLTDYHWIYFMDSDVSINRLVEFKNMSPVDTPGDKTVVCAEVTQPHIDPINRVIDDLHRVGLIQYHDVLDSKVVHEKFAYPVYTHDYDIILNEVQQVLNQYQNLYNVGRAAEFRHREVDDNFASAIQTVDQITKGMPEVARELEMREKAPGKAEKPVVYAVVLAYNNYQDTHECLESLFTSEFPDLRIVLVDNGSSDLTPEKVRRAFPTVNVIETGNNLGVPAGYNVGFRYALQNGADYILMLNNDTVIAPDMISRLMEQAESDPQAGIVMPKVLFYGSNDQIWSSGGRYRRFPPAILFNDRREAAIQAPVRLIEYAPSCGLLIHRRAFEKVGLFDPGYFFLYDDWDFSERVRAHGLNIRFVRDAVMWHKVSQTTRGSQSPLYWYTIGASTARFFRRHGRPVWISIPVHVSYIVLREFGWKRNWKFWGEFWRGVRDGLQKPLGNFPEFSP